MREQEDWHKEVWTHSNISAPRSTALCFDGCISVLEQSCWQLLVSVLAAFTHSVAENQLSVRHALLGKKSPALGQKWGPFLLFQISFTDFICKTLTSKLVANWQAAVQKEVSYHPGRSSSQVATEPSAAGTASAPLAAEGGWRHMNRGSGFVGISTGRAWK